MKNLVYALAICLLVASCEKYDSGQIKQGPANKRNLTESEIILKQNLDEAAKIIADVIQDQSVLSELSIMSEEGRTFYSLPFKDLIEGSKNAVGGTFTNLRDKFLAACSSTESKGSWSDLANFLAKNGCYIYLPYPSSFYPKGTNTFTVAAHPIDNDIENTGYRFEGKKIKEVTVNEEYADKNMVVLIMPVDENDDLIGQGIKENFGSKGDPVYEVKIGKIRCADYCGGIFEGTLELRISRGYPDYNMTTGATTGKFTTVIPIDYPRSYAKAAINNYNVHSEGGWLSIFIPWDTNWRKEKVQQCILVYEYDSVKESTVNATVGYKTDPLNPTITASVKTTYSGDFLGIAEWDRDWFYATNAILFYGDVAKDGWTIRKTCDQFKLITPSNTIY